MDVNSRQAFLILTAAGVTKVNGVHLSSSLFERPPIVVTRRLTYRGAIISILQDPLGGWYARVGGDQLDNTFASPAEAQRAAFQSIDKARE